MDDIKLVTAEVDAIELACLLMETINGVKRAPGSTARDFMDTVAKLDPRVFDAYIEGAKAAAIYMAANLQQALDNAGVGGTLQ